MSNILKLLPVKGISYYTITIIFTTGQQKIVSVMHMSLIRYIVLRSLYYKILNLKITIDIDKVLRIAQSQDTGHKTQETGNRTFLP